MLQELLTKGIGHTDFQQTEIGEIPVGWEVVSIDKICTLTSGGTPSRRNLKYWDGDIPWVKTGEIKYKNIVQTEEYITKEGVDNSAAKLVPKGSVLMAMYGQGKTRGQVAMLDIDASLNQACLAMICNEFIHNKYLYFFFVHSYDDLRNLSQEGAQKNLSATLIKTVKIPLPTLSEQLKIASILSSLDDAILKAELEKERLDSIKKGLMQDLLTGKVRVS